jgi:hypothetical protein
LQVVAQHPLHFLGLYTRHAINGLDVRDGILYTLEASPLRTGLAWFNFTVLALACWDAWSLRTRSMQPLPPGMWPAAAGWRWSLGVLLLPVVAIVHAGGARKPGRISKGGSRPFAAESVRRVARRHVYFFPSFR